jgi:hypothetical protein
MEAEKRTQKVQTNKANYMSDEAFSDLKEALEGVLAFERDERRDADVTRIRAPRPPNADPRTAGQRRRFELFEIEGLRCC